VNTIPVSATDAAGNTTAITRAVAYSCVFGDFNGNWQVDAADVQAVAHRWRATTEPLYDFDGDGVVSVVDVMRVAAAWGNGCP